MKGSFGSLGLNTSETRGFELVEPLERGLEATGNLLVDAGADEEAIWRSRIG